MARIGRIQQIIVTHLGAIQQPEPRRRVLRCIRLVYRAFVPQPQNQIDRDAEIKGDVPDAVINRCSRRELRQPAQSRRHRQREAVPPLVCRRKDHFVKQCGGRVVVGEPAFDRPRQREIAHAVGEQKYPPSLVPDLRQQRLKIGEEARDVKGRTARLALIAKIVVGQQMRRRRNQLTQRRPAERDDGSIGSIRAGGREPLAIVSGAGDRIQKGIGEAVDEDEDVFARSDDILNDPGFELARLWMRDRRDRAAAFDGQVGALDKRRGIGDLARIGRRDSRLRRRTIRDCRPRGRSNSETNWRSRE